MVKARTAVRKLLKRLLRPLWRRVSGPAELVMELPRSLRIASPWETLDECRARMEGKVPGIYLRFGDGEINVLEGGDTIVEKGSPAFAAEMKEVFSLGGPGVLKSLPLHSRRFGLWPGMKPGVHESSDEWAENMLARALPYFVGHKIHSHVALCYVAAFDRPYAIQFLSFLKTFNPLFVGNQDVPEPVLSALFGPGGRVRTPTHDSYREIDRVYRETEAALARKQEFQVVAMAMGCAGRVLAKRLMAAGHDRVFFFDMGSLMDAFYGNISRAWMEAPAGYWQSMLDELAAREART